MANAVKGEVGFKVEGEQFTLAYDFNALCTLEADLGVSVDEIGAKMDSISSLRTMFRIGLEAHHGRLSDLEAGNLIHRIGIEKAGALITSAFQGAFPTPAGGAEGKAKGTRAAGSGAAR